MTSRRRAPNGPDLSEAVSTPTAEARTTFLREAEDGKARAGGPSPKTERCSRRRFRTTRSRSPTTTLRGRTLSGPRPRSLPRKLLVTRGRSRRMARLDPSPTPASGAAAGSSDAAGRRGRRLAHPANRPQSRPSALTHAGPVLSLLNRSGCQFGVTRVWKRGWNGHYEEDRTGARRSRWVRRADRCAPQARERSPVRRFPRRRPRAASRLSRGGFCLRR